MNVKIMRNFLLSIHQLSQAIQTTWTRLNNRLKLQKAIVNGKPLSEPLTPVNWEQPSAEVFSTLQTQSGKTVSLPEMLARIERCQHLHIAIDELQFHMAFDDGLIAQGYGGDRPNTDERSSFTDWLEFIEEDTNTISIPKACNSCRNYHGKTYASDRLVCAIHPYGVEGSCEDWQP
jgi:hypothetical protein